MCFIISCCSFNNLFQDGKEPGYHFNFGGKFAGTTEAVSVSFHFL